MSWTDYEQKDAELRAAGWSVEYPNGHTRITRPPAGYGTPADVPYKKGPWAEAYKRAEWDILGLTWVPVVDPVELEIAIKYLEGGQNGA